jgi:hypothetical protein
VSSEWKRGNGSWTVLTPPNLLKLYSPPPKLLYTSLEELTLFVLIQGQYVALACSRHGSRVLDAIWSGAALGARKEIATELGEYQCFSDVSKLSLLLCQIAGWLRNELEFNRLQFQRVVLDMGS